MDVFISHCEKDKEVSIALATALEEALYSTWYYERDSIPGVSYLQQIIDAVEKCRALLLVISVQSMASEQVDMEVVLAHEGAKPIYAVLLGLEHHEFRSKRGTWAAMLRGNVSVPVTLPEVPSVAGRLVEGLKRRGIETTPRKPPLKSTRKSTPPWYGTSGYDGTEVESVCYRCKTETSFTPGDGGKAPGSCPSCGFDGDADSGPGEKAGSGPQSDEIVPHWYVFGGHDKDGYVKLICRMCAAIDYYTPADREPPPGCCPKCGYSPRSTTAVGRR